MDGSNHADLTDVAPGGDVSRLRMFRDFDPAPTTGTDVPDPYFGDDDGFGSVLATVERAPRRPWWPRWKPSWAGADVARMGTIANRAETLLGATVVATTPVAGGDICTSARLRLSDGSALVKTRPHAPDDFFTTEAEGLRWLARPPAPPYPRSSRPSRTRLILSWVETARPSVDVAERFGRQLPRPTVPGRRGSAPCPAGGLHRHPAAAEPAGPHVARVLRHPPHPAVPAGPGPRQHRPGGRRRGGGRRPPDRRPRRARGAAGADPRRPLVGQRAVGQGRRAGWSTRPRTAATASPTSPPRAVRPAAAAPGARRLHRGGAARRRLGGAGAAAPAVPAAGACSGVGTAPAPPRPRRSLACSGRAQDDLRSGWHPDLW